MQKGISYRIPNLNKSVKIKVYCMQQSNNFLPALAKKSLITLGAIAKGFLLSQLLAESANFMQRQYCSNVPLGKFNLK
jgi:hypothetical protein